MYCSLSSVLTVLFIHTAGASQMHPEPFLYCNKIQDPKKKIACKKNRSFGTACRSPSRCQHDDDLTVVEKVDPNSGQLMTIKECKASAVARRVGMVCSDGWYNGGWPITRIRANGEWEHYKCIQKHPEHDFCDIWETREDTAEEYKLGTYDCTEIRRLESGLAYCHKWTSRQKKTKKCKRVEQSQPNAASPSFCIKVCCGKYSCNECGGYAPHSETGFSTAACINTNEFGACMEWKQEEEDHFDFHFREYEQYRCIILSQNQRYCRKWVGDIESQEKFEKTTCQCTDKDSIESTFCRNWSCYEYGHAYFYPNVLWFILPLSWGILSVICLSQRELYAYWTMQVLYAFICVVLAVVASRVLPMIWILCLTHLVTAFFSSYELRRFIETDRWHRGPCFSVGMVYFVYLFFATFLGGVAALLLGTVVPFSISLLVAVQKNPRCPKCRVVVYY